jgi:peptide/nickel transport system substrate-binding protein
MTIRISRRTALAGGAAGASLLAAPAVWGQAINRDRIILGMTQEPVQFNPILFVNAGTENVPEACLFDALWDINDKGAFIPNLAAQVPSRQNGGVSADGLTWTINLKRDVKWSDGAPFTAKDVEFTYQAIVSPNTPVRSRTGFDLIKAFRVKDDFTIEIELSRQFVPFLWAWQNMHIIPRHILGNEANLATAAFNANPVGTGPFLLRSRTAGSHMVYERNPNYHRGPAKVRQFIHKFVPETMAA